MTEFLLDFIKEELEEGGVELPEVPFGLAEIDVTADGKVSVTEPGVQLIYVSHPDARIPAAPVLVLAGFKLKEISLQPESAITTGSRLLIEQFKKIEIKKEENEGEAEEEEEDDEVNPPLILTTTDLDPGYTTSIGYVRLTDMKFEYLGEGEVSISNLVELLEKIRNLLQIKETPQEKAVKRFLSLIVSGAATEGLVDFQIDNFSIADFCTDVPGILAISEGCITGQAPGMTNVNGSVDLNTFTLGPLTFDIGLGEAEDSVVTWVLPALQSAKLEPVVTTLRVGSVVQKEVRTFVMFDWHRTGSFTSRRRSSRSAFSPSSAVSRT